MDIRRFTEIRKDRSFCNFEKLSYKYGEDFRLFLDDYRALCCQELPLTDENGRALVYTQMHAGAKQSSVKLLLKSREQPYGLRAAEDEIVSTCAIESIDFSRDSVRSILRGYAPRDEQEQRILGLKRGFEFIAADHPITEENLYELYRMTVGDFLSGEDALVEGQYYRHDEVFVVSDRIEHTGLRVDKLPDRMRQLLAFINAEDGIDDLDKAAIIHFYFCFVHPYFDGNGRMARLLHLWFLIRRGYQSALFLPFSSHIERTRKKYYDAYTNVEGNRKFTQALDLTPFLIYFTENVYNTMGEGSVGTDVLALCDSALRSGKLTEKEAALWKFVLSCYGTEEFSTKRLEKDFGDAAYATVRAFVRKLEALGLLVSIRYGTRVKYRVAEDAD